MSSLYLKINLNTFVLSKLALIAFVAFGRRVFIHQNCPACASLVAFLVQSVAILELQSRTRFKLPVACEVMCLMYQVRPYPARYRVPRYPVYMYSSRYMYSTTIVNLAVHAHVRAARARAAYCVRTRACSSD